MALDLNTRININLVVVRGNCILNNSTGEVQVGSQMGDTRTGVYEARLTFTSSTFMRVPSLPTKISSMSTRM